MGRDLLSLLVCGVLRCMLAYGAISDVRWGGIAWVHGRCSFAGVSVLPDLTGHAARSG